MRRLAPAAVVLALALVGGSARADTFAVLPQGATDVTLPSVASPNGAGSITLPFALSTPPAEPAQLSYPQLLSVWQRAGAAYGIPWQVLAAINKVESNFGRNMGPSSAGAIGWMQFMPSTWLRWGTDANGDGVADPWNPQDAIYSAARYLAAAGGGSDLYRAVFAYNHADWYVQEVLGLASTFGSDGMIAFAVDRAQATLDSARAAVVDANDRLLAARDDVRALARRAAGIRVGAAHAALLSDRLALEARAAHLDEQRAAAEGVVQERTSELAAAQARLAQAQQAAAGASLQPGTAQLMAAPSYASDGYVFPVGGGPGVVSASHTHHDYPAVDIAAPSGSPLYALADGVVLRSWASPDARCGIGFTFRAADGQEWTYCHLAVLDSTVVAGAPVGLVGQTGHATGPHLHLQLVGATAWPQQEPWFQSFAGRAFTWSDGAADPGEAVAQPTRTLAFVPTPQRPAPVFEVVPAAPETPVVLFTREGS